MLLFFHPYISWKSFHVTPYQFKGISLVVVVFVVYICIILRGLIYHSLAIGCLCCFEVTNNVASDNFRLCMIGGLSLR